MNAGRRSLAHALLMGPVMRCCFAIFSNESVQPVAVFEVLEDAMDWAYTRFGGDAFRIRYLDLAPVQSDENRPRPDSV